ncbi:hypothetical protein N8T02_09085 [Enterobacter asburiae]|nr:hypothetical protein [Enterobacter asburiae]MCU3138307.1 hypothetical protein [Enterobacter asburiae]
MSQDINNTVATSKTRRVIKNLRWYVLVLFLLGVTVNYITLWGGDRFCMVVMWGKKGAEAMNDGGCEAR